jgi:hypothetical protein
MGRLPPTTVRMNQERQPRSAFNVLHRRWRHEAKYGIYWIYSRFILSHIVLAKLQEKYSDRYRLSMQTTSSQSRDINWPVICTDGWNPSSICRVRIDNWPKKLAPCILSQEVGPGCNDRKFEFHAGTTVDQLQLVPSGGDSGNNMQIRDRIRIISIGPRVICIRLGQVRWSFVNVRKAFGRFRKRSGLLGLASVTSHENLAT